MVMAKEHNLDVFIAGFAGTDNVQDAARLKIENGLAGCAMISNYDISDTYSAITRQGTGKIYSGTPHSFDPNGSGYFVEGNYFKQLMPDYTVYTFPCVLKAPYLPMSYTKVNYLTVCSNSVDLFIIENGVISAFRTPTATFKEAIQAAQIVFFFGRRLYYVIGNVLYYSDADNIEQSDTRDDPFVFNKPIMMVLPLDNGIYVGADKVYWLSGQAPEEMTIPPGSGYDGAVVAGTGISFDASLVGGTGKIGMFTATDGICLGADNGQVQNLTLNKIAFTDGHRGAALIRKSGDFNQYISWV
jgi:hypothetical protein